MPFMRRVKERYPNKDVWAYTGYLYEELLAKRTREHTEYTDEAFVHDRYSGRWSVYQRNRRIIHAQIQGLCKPACDRPEKDKRGRRSVHTGIYENLIRGFEMKKKCDRLLGILCYALGILAALYVGGYLMLIKPIHVIIIAFGNDMLTLPLLLKSIIKIAFSTRHLQGLCGASDT